MQTNSTLIVVLALVALGVYFYLRKDRDLNRELTGEEKRQAAECSDLRTILTEPDSERSFSMIDAVKIEIETSGSGPFDDDLYWIFHLQTEPPIRMAWGVAHEQEIFDILAGVGRLNFEEFDQSNLPNVPKLFLIWEKGANE